MIELRASLTNTIFHDRAISEIWIKLPSVIVWCDWINNEVWRQSLEINMLSKYPQWKSAERMERQNSFWWFRECLFFSSFNRSFIHFVSPTDGYLWQCSSISIQMTKETEKKDSMKHATHSKMSMSGPDKP